MKKLSQIKLNDFDELNVKEMKKIVGGARVIGVRFYNGSCYCDILHSNSSGNTTGVMVCDQPCELIWCEEAGITTGIGVL